MRARATAGFGAVALVALGLAGAASTPADAALRCHGAYQVNPSGEIRTPFCEAEYLAQVARQRGMRVSGAAIRGSFGVKRDVCEVVGRDNRVSEICTGVLPDPGDRNPFFLVP